MRRANNELAVSKTLACSSFVVKFNVARLYHHTYFYRTAYLAAAAGIAGDDVCEAALATKTAKLQTPPTKGLLLTECLAGARVE